MDDFFYQLEEVTKVGSLQGLLDSNAWSFWNGKK